MTIEEIKNNLNRWRELELENTVNIFSSRPFLVFNKQEWLMSPLIKFTEEEIDNADEKGFIASRGGVDCYLAKKLDTVCK